MGLVPTEIRTKLNWIDSILSSTAGNLFGVSLSTLLLRDSQLTADEGNVPLVFQKLLYELSKRGVKEEGILRVGGHKQKVIHS